MFLWKKTFLLYCTVGKKRSLVRPVKNTSIKFRKKRKKGKKDAFKMGQWKYFFGKALSRFETSVVDYFAFFTAFSIDFKNFCEL